MNLDSMHELYDLCPQGILVTDGTRVIYRNDASQQLLTHCGVSLCSESEQEIPLPDVLQVTLTISQPHVISIGYGLLTAFSYPLQGKGLSVIQLSPMQLSGLSGDQLGLIARRLRDVLSASMMALDFLAPEPAPESEFAPPLEDNVVRLFPDVPDQGNRPEDYCAILRRGQYRLLRTANELQLLSDLSKGKENFPLYPLDLGALIQEVFWEIDDLDLKRELMLSFDAQSFPVVLGHEALLRQLLLNLISNAIESSASQFAATGTVSSDGKQISLVIRDNGIGLSKEAISQSNYPLLDPTSYSAKLGSGLAICRQIVLLHNGSFLFQSSPEGTIYTISLPVAQVPEDSCNLDCGFAESPYGDPYVELADVLTDATFTYPV